MLLCAFAPRPSLEQAFAALHHDPASAAEAQSEIEDAWRTADETGIDILKNRAVAAIDQERFDLAAVLLANVTQLAPSFNEGWVLYGDVLQRQGHFGPARTAFTQALRAEPRDYRAMVKLGELARSQGQTTEALGHFQDALRIHPYLPGLKARLDDIERDAYGREI
ncbi:tetratricopeptide repeat protein [Parvularcula bermudensis]|nr:tetratricopeptide repeat protein [Parvularcula bermudensis]